MNYGKFAYVYDRLMEDVPYEKWLAFLIGQKKKYLVEGSRVLDLACGTGELSVMLAGEGFSVVGVDLSEDMLMAAREKADREKADVSFFLQDMRELEGLGKFDLAAVFCDSLNYLGSEDEVRETFSRIHRHLDSNGLFLFDVHSVRQIEEEFANKTFTLNDEDISYIWNSFPGESPFSVEHELSFFVQDEITGLYERFDELHQQRTYPLPEYEQMLIEAGFTILEVTADFTDNPPDADSSRIFFTCKINKEKRKVS